MVQAPAFSKRSLNAKKRNAWITGFSIGYMKQAKDKVIVDQYKLTGGTFGMIIDLGYNIGLSENLSMGFQPGFISWFLTQDDVNKA
ncbi:MAG: hypothetical protein CVU06_06055 [Bacteroidetes bacterium HGW-Bacteroidetes-22]|nr:MAG: hypothetical protein CVU06_06055 [Bacteroidetes bacterium HGW-Bacteroidetes-22]